MEDDPQWRAKFHARWVAAGEEFDPEPPPPPPPQPAPEPEPEPWVPNRDAPVTLGRDEDGRLVELTPAQRCEHALLVGKTGQGKSNLMRLCMRQDMEAGRGFVCLDPHGKLVDDVLSDVPIERQHDVVYLDCADEDWPFGLNLFEAPPNITPKSKATMISQLLQAFDKCWEGGFSGTAEIVIKSVCQTFLDNRRGTLAMIPRLLSDRDYREAFYPRITDPFTKLEWKRITNSRTGELKNDETDPIMRRLNKFVGNPIVRNLMGQTKTTLAFPRWMDEDAIVLIKIPDDDSTGIGKDAAQLVATVILQLILRAAYGREVGSPLWSVYCDEFQHYVTGDIPVMLRNTRKYGVGLFLATQSFSDVDTAILGAGTLLCYQLTDRDARIVAGEFRKGVELAEDWEEKIKTEIIGGDSYRYQETVYSRPTRAEIASRLANLKALVGTGNCLAKIGGHEHVVDVPNIERLPRGYKASLRSPIIARSRERYCRPRWEVEREIMREVAPGGDDDAGVLFDEAPPAWG